MNRSCPASLDGTVPSLLNLSAKIVAENIPFRKIEQRYEFIPEPVQRRIIFWSFPSNEDDIKMYSSVATDYGSTLPLSVQSTRANQQSNATIESVNNNNFQPVLNGTTTINNNLKFQGSTKQLTFLRGSNLCNEGLIKNVLQVGFTLSGTVYGDNLNHSSINNKAVSQTNTQNQSDSGSISSQSKHYKVSVNFDRCKITSVSCSCNFQDIFWCEHIVALVLHRIRNPETIDLRVPISETLSSLSKQQLQKLALYLISEHHTEVLPTAQRLLDEMTLSTTSSINLFDGAPDSTAGGSDENVRWHFDMQQLHEKTKKNLESIGTSANITKETHKHISSLFEKIKEMFCAKDSNGVCLLKYITIGFLNYANKNEKCRPLWDQLVNLWVVFMSNPDINEKERQKYLKEFNEWSKSNKCPKEDIERRITIKRRVPDDHNGSVNSDSLIPCRLYGMSCDQGNNYPAHMGSHNRSFNPASSFPLVRSFNQMISSTSSSCVSCNLYKPCAKRWKSQSGRPVESQRESRSSHQVLDRSDENNHIQIEMRQNLEPRTIFNRVLDSATIKWDNKHLQFILSNDGPCDYDVERTEYFDCNGYPIWIEPISLAAIRVITLKTHGYTEQALRLALATIRKLKMLQDQIFDNCSCKNKSLHWFLLDSNEGESWIGHPADPANILFDTLLESSTTPTINTSPSIIPNNTCRYGNKCGCIGNLALANQNSSILNPSILSDPSHFNYNNHSSGFDFVNSLHGLARLSARRALGASSSHLNQDKTSYYHVPIPGCYQWQDSYLSMAVEIAVICLGQRRPISSIQTAQERALRQEADLISKLESVNTPLDPILVNILSHQAEVLIKRDAYQDTLSPTNSSSEYAPMHTFARFLFEALVSQNPSLAYNLGVHILKLPLNQDENAGENYAANRSRNVNNAQLQAEQLALAQTMMSKAKDDNPRGWLMKIYKASIKNIRNPNNLLKLAKHALKDSKPVSQVTLYPTLLKTALDLGLQVLKITMNPQTVNVKTRKDSICFIVECVTELGLDIVIQLMKDWKDYFAPIEALSLVVGSNNESNLRTQAASKFKLKENQTKEAELYRRSRDLALECAKRDPSNCALDALKFCETHPEARDSALRIVMDSGRSGSLDSGQLIRVADHVYERGLRHEAFDISLVAVDSLSIPSNVENSAAKKDILRACELAREVNRFDLIIPKLIKNVECAVLLSEIYHTFGPDYRRIDHNSLYYSFQLNNRPDINGQARLQSHRNPDLWSLLLKTANSAFDSTARNRLVNISPRHYGEFIDFLTRAQSCFEKAADGPQQFRCLILDIMKSYKTKKKLMERLKLTFDHHIKAS